MEPVFPYVFIIGFGRLHNFGFRLSTHWVAQCNKQEVPMQQPDQLQFQMQQRVKQQQLIMQQALLQQQQQSLYHPALLTAMSQIEPIPSGNLPPGFDSSSCRSVYVGNIHVNVTQSLLADVFGSIGPLEACKLISKDKTSFGFVDYFDHRSAAAAIMTLNGRQIFGQPIKVNWAYASGQREDTSGHYSIFVGDLSPEVTDATLFACFSVYQSCSDARVMWDQKSGRSRGFGFVSFRNQQDAQNAINELTGKWLGSRQIRCNWAAKSNSGNQNDEKQNAEKEISLNGASANAGVNEISTEGHKENAAQGAGPENNPQYTTVYVGNLTHEVTQSELHRQFHALGAGVIEDVRVQRDKGFGFVRYHSHAEAALAIQMANGRVICGKSIKCSWGSKPTPPGTASAPLPPPPAATFPAVAASGLNQGYTAADLLAYQRQLSMAQGGSGQSLLQVAGQQGLGQASVGLGAGTNRSMYDIGQQLMYY